jgi:HK97 family phage major capsid protein
MNKLDKLEKTLQELDTKLDSTRKAPSNNTPSKEEVFGAPFARKGESALSNRGFMFSKLIGVVAGVVEPEDAKVELELARRLNDQFCVHGGFKKVAGKNVTLAPLGTDLMCLEKQAPIDNNFRNEIKSLTSYGVSNADPEEMLWIAKKAYGQKANQSWIDQTLGGSLVAPPAFGELIQLLRNKDALINAGARVEALPPQGRLKLPRQTTPTTGYYVGENQSITSSNFGTGFLELSAKKVACIVTMPNELIRYASPASEAVLRADMTKTLSLTMDYQLLYGEGSDVYPLGLINTPNIVTITPTDSQQLAPQDLLAFVSAIEANNGEFQGFILRPELFYSFAQSRAGVYNGSAIVNQGQFVYDQFRQLGQGFPKQLGGYNATTTSQVSITRGSGSQTSCFGGQWDDYIIAMFGSIEFAQATQGDTAFANDQTVVRAILSHDGAARHPGVFAVADPISLSVGV